MAVDAVGRRTLCAVQTEYFFEPTVQNDAVRPARAPGFTIHARIRLCSVSSRPVDLDLDLGPRCPSRANKSSPALLRHRTRLYGQCPRWALLVPITTLGVEEGTFAAIRSEPNSTSSTLGWRYRPCLVSGSGGESRSVGTIPARNTHRVLSDGNLAD